MVGRSDFPEVDWKAMRRVHEPALQRYCDRILNECRDIISSMDLTPHERYLSLIETLRRRDRELASAFDDMRRSRALEHLARMIQLQVITDEELSEFTPETRSRAQTLARGGATSRDPGV